jgi:hypothetical protein
MPPNVTRNSDVAVRPIVASTTIALHTVGDRFTLARFVSPTGLAGLAGLIGLRR